MFLVIAAVLFALWLFVTVTSKVTGAMIHLLLVLVAVFVILQFVGVV